MGRSLGRLRVPCHAPSSELYDVPVNCFESESSGSRDFSRMGTLLENSRSCQPMSVDFPYTLDLRRT